MKNNNNDTCCGQESFQDTPCQTLINVQEKLTQAEKQILYLRADIDNVRRSALREVQLKSQKHAVDIITIFLNMCDDFQRCAEAIQKSSDSTLHEGIHLVQKSMLKAFDELGIKTIETSKDFDPEKHEAISYAPSSESHPEGTIISVIRPGFIYQEKVIRPAQVVVASDL